jgi:hypothetical protein
MLSPSLDRDGNVAPTVVVNEAFVRKFLATAKLDAVGQRMDDDPKSEKWTQIVGVVGDVRQDIYEPPMAERDWIMEEIPAKERLDSLNGMSLVVRFAGDPGPIIPALRNALHEVDATVPFNEVRSMSDVVSQTLVFERMESWLFGIFASLALALALVGLYGLVSQEVEQSRRDIGVRMALGASRQRILGMVLRHVSVLLLAGTLTGLVLTVSVQRLIGMVIYFDAGKEAAGFVALALVLVVVGMCAALLPARRAASIEPMQALRSE